MAKNDGFYIEMGKKWEKKKKKGIGIKTIATVDWQN
jgi:hypothetical protein